MTSPDGLTYNQNLIIAITTLVLALAYISYALRLYARRVSGAKVWWDDYMIGGGLVRDIIVHTRTILMQQSYDPVGLCDHPLC